MCLLKVIWVICYFFKELSAMTGTPVGLIILNNNRTISTYFTDDLLKISKQISLRDKSCHIKCFAWSREPKFRSNIFTSVLYFHFLFSFSIFTSLWIYATEKQMQMQTHLIVYSFFFCFIYISVVVATLLYL